MRGWSSTVRGIVVCLRRSTSLCVKKYCGVCCFRRVHREPVPDRRVCVKYFSGGFTAALDKT